MCGICGQYNFERQEPVQAARVRTMARAIAHRGPDDEGFFLSGPIGLGFRRLSIIDLEGGHQPMSDAEGSVQVVFNGEIYNFRELRSDLMASGHTFRTRSDTEVIVHGYKQWGADVLNRLNGMFGLAIWDEVAHQLLLARDSTGIKPLYYRVDSGSVLFGSEIRAILAALPASPATDMTALNLFLRYRYTPSPLTLYEGIRKLAPGTMALFSARRWHVERWHRTRPVQRAQRISDVQATRELLELYKRALERHLISDVPVGLLLSGGVDSGLLLGLMTLHGDGWPTYTVGYGKASYREDELSEAAETAAIFGAKNIAVELSQGEFEQALPKIVSALEEPVATSSIVPMYFVSQRARQDVKVALIGQGPDELFGGYKRHLGVHYGALWRALPTRLRRVAEAGIGLLPRNETLKRGVYALSQVEAMQRYQHVFSITPGGVVDDLFQEGLAPHGAGNVVCDLWKELEPDMAGMDELGAFQVLEVRSSLPDELLMYADKLSMAHGLEVRVPFLDKEVVEYARQLPASMKMRLGQGKWLHKQVCRQFLPPSILARKKRGFAVNVVDAWLRRSFSGKLIGHLADPQSLMFRSLRPRAVRRLLHEHHAGTADHHKILFSLVVYEEWLRSNRSAPRGPAQGFRHDISHAAVRT